MKQILSKKNKDGLTIYPPEGFEMMRKAGRLAAEVLDMVTDHVKDGVTTNTLDKMCHDYILDHRATPAPLGYKGYPKSVCTSINHVVCHGIPDDKPLKVGDILNIDVTVILDGWYGDTSRMYWVGDEKDISVKAKRLTAVTYAAMMDGINTVKPGSHLGDIGAAIEKIAKAERFGVVEDFCGHGIGTVFHEQPQVVHFGKAGTGLQLETGMIFTIEPMINAGTAATKVLADGWTAVTRDRQLSAQFEHTVGVTETGVEIFTLSPKELHYPPYAKR